MHARQRNQIVRRLRNERLPCQLDVFEESGIVVAALHVTLFEPGSVDQCERLIAGVADKQMVDQVAKAVNVQRLIVRNQLRIVIGDVPVHCRRIDVIVEILFVVEEIVPERLVEQPERSVRKTAAQVLLENAQRRARLPVADRIQLRPRETLVLGDGNEPQDGFERFFPACLVGVHFPVEEIAVQARKLRRQRRAFRGSFESLGGTRQKILQRQTGVQEVAVRRLRHLSRNALLQRLFE